VLFSTPSIAFSEVLSLYIFFDRREKQTGQIRLTEYPEAQDRGQLYLIIREAHNQKKPEPVENPRWLVIPDRGFFTGIASFGAIGTGKFNDCMYPFAKLRQTASELLRSGQRQPGRWPILKAKCDG